MSIAKWKRITLHWNQFAEGISIAIPIQHRYINRKNVKAMIL